jgi:thioredoxin reductase (NADPH)
MLTVDDIRTIPIFATLAPPEVNRLVQAAADLHLEPGEYATPEGGERALYAVLSGKIEVVKQVDGVERHLGWRLPGAIFGEVPLALGSNFPGGYRATEPSRVLRLEATQYYLLAASSSEFATQIGALARERLGGLQAIAAEPPSRG